MRRLRTILVLLFLGAVVNVAVAWGAVVIMGFSERRTVVYLDRSQHPQLHCLRTSAPGTEMLYNFGTGEGIGDTDFEVAPRNAWWTGLVRRSATLSVVGVAAAGWPMFSLMCWADGISESGSLVQHGVFQVRTAHLPSWIRRWNPMGDVAQFPYRPLWPGFLANTLFYAGLLTVVFYILGLIRRRLRTWRGRCHRCGYPSAGTGTCPECGTALPTSTASSPTPRMTPQP